MEEQFEEINIGLIKLVPSDVEIPVNDFPILTKRSLCANTPENLSLLDRIDAVKVITDIEDNIESNPLRACQIIALAVEDLLAVYNPLNVLDCSSDLFTETISVIDNLIELRKALSEVLIRFDTSPDHYTKEDYFALLKVLYLSLYYLYSLDGSIVITWSDPLLNTNIPSEKLVKETIDQVKEDCTYTAGEGISINENNVISNTRVSAEWGNITGDIEDLEDLQETLESKADTSALTSHTTNTNNPHSVTKSLVGLGNVDNTSDLNKPISTATQNALDLKLDTLTAGDNIDIINNVISATDTITEVIDNTTSSDTDKALSAHMGKELLDEINNLKSRGRFLSLWKCTTGLPETTPTTLPYNYHTGDYFIVSAVAGSTPVSRYKHLIHMEGLDTSETTNYNVDYEFESNVSTQHNQFLTIYNDLVAEGYYDRTALAVTGTFGGTTINWLSADSLSTRIIFSYGEERLQRGNASSATLITDTVTPLNEVTNNEAVNYRPNGSQYTGAASTTEETEEVKINDTYYYDGSLWKLLKDTGKTLSFENIAGDPYDNTELSNALNDKQDTIIDGSATIAIESNNIVTLKSGVTLSEGSISNNTGSDITLAKVAKTGSYDDLSNKPDISNKEDKSNKVSTFLITPDNLHYPSEKLVKDNLDSLLGLIAICL